MSSINGVGNSVSIQPAAPQRVGETAAPANASASRGSDRVDLSAAATSASAPARADIRTDKVAAIKAQIAAGNYEDDYKLDVAIDRLLDDLQK